MKTKVFEYVFGRIGGVPFDLLQNFETFDTDNYQAYKKADELYESTKNDLIMLLYGLIGTCQNQIDKELLISLKRDIYNNRSILKYLDHPVLINDDIVQIIHKYLFIQDYKKNTELSIQYRYKSCLKQSELQVKKISEMYFIRNGLLFSSESMVKNVEKLNSENKWLNKKKENKMIISLLRYITRSGAKTSPFSSYNKIFALRYNKSSFSPEHILNSSIISINNLVYMIFDEILLADYSIRNSFFVSLNPTISCNDSHINYFYNSKNNEAFFNVKKSKILEFVINLLSKKDNLIYDVLSKSVEKATNETSKNVSQYVDGLIKEGVIIIKLPVSVNDIDWPTKLIRMLKNVRCDNRIKLESLISILNKLIESKRELECINDIKKREIIIKQSYFVFYSKLEEIIQISGMPQLITILTKITESDLFYEDNVTDEIPKLKYQLSNIFDKLTSLNRILQSNSIKREFRIFFAQQIKRLNVGTKIPLLKFYQDIYLNNNFIENIVCTYQTNFLSTFDIFFKSLQTKNNYEDIDIMPFFKEIHFKDSVSFDLFTQIATINNTNVLVINSILPGGGTNISRFINLYPKQSINELLKHELDLFYGDSTVAHITDASIHNTNTFLPLTEHIIDVSLKGQNCHTNINLSDLYICLDSKNYVRIEDSSGKIIVPMNFSMESILRKSSLMKFIDLFNDNSPEGLPTLLNFYENVLITLHANESVIFVPRLCYSNEIILSRKKWFVRKSILKSRILSCDSEAIQFLLFNEWRKEAQIPEHFFVKDTPVIDKNYKPQYINAEAPIFFRLFKSLLEINSEFIIISEMLPSYEHLIENGNNEQFVMEYIFSLMNKN